MDRTHDILVSPSRFWRSRDFGDELPLPEPFTVRLDAAVTHVWAGVVQEAGHTFDGQSVYLSQRGEEWNGEVVVEVSPAAREGYFSGYAQLDRQPLKARVERSSLRPPSSAPHDLLRALWARAEHEYDRRVAHGPAEVASLAAHYGFRLPDDFRDYLIHACSTIDDGGTMDGFQNAWWGLERIRSVIEECGGPETDPALATASLDALFFADTLLWSTAWAICCGEGPDFGRVFLVSSRSRFVADSFTEFVDRYLNDDQALY